MINPEYFFADLKPTITLAHSKLIFDVLDSIMKSTGKKLPCGINILFGKDFVAIIDIWADSYYNQTTKFYQKKEINPEKLKELLEYCAIKDEFSFHIQKNMADIIKGVVVPCA